jgi:hypothetical protein
MPENFKEEVFCVRYFETPNENTIQSIVVAQPNKQLMITQAVLMIKSASSGYSTSSILAGMPSRKNDQNIGLRLLR